MTDINFQDLLIGCMQPDNDVRNEAERVLFELVNERPDEVMVSLIESIASGYESVPEMACLVMRRVFTKRLSKMWGNLKPSTQNIVKSELVRFMQGNADPDLLKKVTDCAATLAIGILPDGQWSEFLLFLQEQSKSSNPAHRMCAFSAFGQSLRVDLKPHNATLRELISAGLEDDEPPVRLEAVQCLNYFLMTSRDEIPHFHARVGNIIEIVTVCNENKDHEEARNGLSLLIELAETAPLLMRPALTPIADTMFELAANANAQDETRHMAVEMLVTLCEARPGMIRKEGVRSAVARQYHGFPDTAAQSIVPRLIPLLVEMIHTVSENEDWNEGEEADMEDTTHKVGSESLDRVARVLTGASVIPILFDLAPQLLQSGEWTHRFAALMAICVVGEGCNAHMKPYLGNVLDMVLPVFGDPHPRVRWAACNAVGQMCTDFGKNHHEKVVPFIVSLMDDHDNPRVQSHATAAIINFCEMAKSQHIVPYAYEMLKKMSHLLQASKKIVLEQCMTAVGTVADVMGKEFSQFYDSFVPFLKSVMIKATSREMRYLRGRAIEAVSLIAAAVGKERFMPDAKEVTDIMLDIERAPKEADDPITSLLQQAWARMANCLKEDFAPFLEVILPPLLHDAALDPHVTILPQHEIVQYKNDDSWEVVPVGDRHVAIKTSALEVKGQAFNMLYCYLEYLQEHFYPHLMQTAALFSTHITFYYHDGVRTAAVASPPHIIRCVKRHYEQHGQNSQGAVNEMMNKMMPDICSGLETEMSLDHLILLVYAVTASLDLCDNYPLTEESLTALSHRLLGLLKDFFDRVDERVEKRNEEDFDEVEAARAEATEKREDQVMEVIAGLMGKLVEKHKEQFIPYFNHIACTEHFHKLLGPASRPVYRQSVICIFDDVVQFGGPAGVPFFENICNTFLNFVMDEAAIVRQACVYGIGVLASSGEPTLKPRINDVLEVLHTLMVHETAHEDECITVTENCVSALSKMLRAFPDVVSAEQIIPAIVAELPLRIDPQERVLVHDLFCDFVQQRPADVFGQNYERVAKVLYILAEVLDTPLASAETQERMKGILNAMNSEIPGEALSQAFAQLNDDCKAKINAVTQ